MKKLYYFLMKSMFCLSIFLILGILCKKDINYKKNIEYQLYQNHISFSYFKDIYNRYLGGVFPIENISSQKTTAVFDEKLKYSAISSHKDGAVLSVGKNYLVPNMEEGIVVYLGTKDDYGEVVMIENASGIDTWYGNMCHITVKLYDQVDKGTYLGEACDETLYLVYTKGNKFLNYQDYLK